MLFVHWVGYYIANMARGVYPLWNPFHDWGYVDNFYMINFGALNPVYLLMSFFVFCGCKVYWAFLSGTVFYFWMGCLGFYILARQVIGGKTWPFLAYVFLMFSSLGVNVFTFESPLILFVPTVWFFVFLTGFVRAKKSIRRLFHAMGLTFALMVIISTYIPFYFIVIFGCFCLACMLAARYWIFQALKALVTFIRKAPWVALLCVSALMLACAPSVIWYHEVNTGQMVQNDEQRTSSGGKNIVETTLDTISLGALAGMTSWKEMFSDLNAGGNNNNTSYVPVLIFIFGGLSLFNRSHRPQAVLFICGLLMFLFALAEMTPIFPFLYKHFYFFHLFRNYWLFGPFIIALVVLFLIGELKEFVSYHAVSIRDKTLRIIFITAVHVLFFIFLSHLDNVPMTSFVTVILSGIWFILWQMDLLPIKEGALVAGLAAIAILQPMQVLPYSENQGGVHPYPYYISKPEFGYMRPLQGSGFNEGSGLYPGVKLCRDDSGFVKKEYIGTKSSYALYSHIPHEFLRDYVQYKFVLYDRTAFMDYANPDWEKLKGHLANFENEAIVGDKNAVKKAEGIPAQATAIRGPGKELKVLAFDLNTIRIKTDFPTVKFLVYNDSYYPGWQAFIDGQKTSLYQANMAFKGLWVPAGEHIIDLKFLSGRYYFSVFLVLFFGSWLMALFVLYRKSR